MNNNDKGKIYIYFEDDAYDFFAHYNEDEKLIEGVVTIKTLIKNVGEIEIEFQCKTLEDITPTIEDIVYPYII